MGKQFFVQIKGYNERSKFYDYIHKNFNLEDKFFDKEKMSSSNFPFVIDFEDNYLTVVESSTVCACAAQKKRIISEEECKKQLKK